MRPPQIMLADAPGPVKQRTPRAGPGIADWTKIWAPVFGARRTPKFSLDTFSRMTYKEHRDRRNKRISSAVTVPSLPNRGHRMRLQDHRGSSVYALVGYALLGLFLLALPAAAKGAPRAPEYRAFPLIGSRLAV